MKTIITSNSTNIDVSYKIASAISATPKSDVTGNINLVVSNGTLTSNNYVKVDYEGTDRVGFKIDTASMGNTHTLQAIYLITKWEQGNNKWHVPLGYNDLGDGKRFFTKKYLDPKYIFVNDTITDINEAKAGMTLNDNTSPSTGEVQIPSGIYLTSATNLNITKSSLSGTLGYFPTGNTHGGDQKISELIIFTNSPTHTEHANLVKYLMDKWGI